MNSAQDEPMIILLLVLLEIKLSKHHPNIITSYRGISFIHQKILCWCTIAHSSLSPSLPSGEGSTNCLRFLLNLMNVQSSNIKIQSVGWYPLRLFAHWCISALFSSVWMNNPLRGWWYCCGAWKTCFQKHQQQYYHRLFLSRFHSYTFSSLKLFFY